MSYRISRMRIKRILYDILTALLVVGFLHEIREYTRNALETLQAYTPQIANIQEANILAHEETIHAIEALTHKTLMINYIAIPIGVLLIFFITQGLLWQKEYKVPIKHFVITALPMAAAGLFMIGMTLNAATYFVYAEQTSLLIWGLSILLFFTLSYFCFNRLIHPRKTYKQIAQFKLYKEHALMMLTSLLILLGIALIYIFLQIGANQIFPIIVLLIGVYTRDIVRDWYIKRSKKLIKSKRKKRV